MAFYRCGSGKKTYIDGEEVKEDLNLATVFVDYELDNLPQYFDAVSAVVYDSKLHLLGGYSSNGSCACGYHYAWDGSSWTNVSTLPTALYPKKEAVLYNDKIHLLYNTYHYAWNGSSWTSVSTLPMTVDKAVVYNKKIYIFNGKSCYSWNGSSWTSVYMPYFSSDSNGHVCNYAIVNNDKIYLQIAYYNGSSGATYKTYSYNGSSWTLLNTRTTSYSVYIDGSSKFIYDGKIYEIRSSAVYLLDTDTDTLTKICDFNACDQWYGGTTAWYKNCLYALGGEYSTTSKDTGYKRHFKIVKYYRKEQ